MSDRPNLLLICTDQQAATAASCAANRDLRTPAIDALAQAGTRFGSAYCTQPLCGPSRASLFTGLMPQSCGVVRNEQPIPAEFRERELGRVLAAAGYDCLYAGKWHIPEIAMPATNDHGFRLVGGFDDNRIAASCRAVFRSYARTGTGRPSRPFFLVAGIDNPHNICEWARDMALPWGGLGTPPDVTDCPSLPANFMPAPFEPEAIRTEQAAHWNLYPYRQRSPEDWRRLRWAYFRLVERADREVGRILAALQASGLDDRTLVIFTSDHGDGHGAHRWNQKSALFEEIVRVPLIVRPPGGGSPRCDPVHLVSTGLDVYPTLCDYAGVRPPAGLPGRSLRALVEGRAPRSWREAVFVQTLFDGGRGYNTQGCAVRTAEHKYVVYDRGQYREQLFDLVQDPGEMVNLALDSRCRDRLRWHRALLREHLSETGERFRRHLMPG